MRAIVFPLAELAKLPGPNDDPNDFFENYLSSKVSNQEFKKTKVYLCTGNGTNYVTSRLNDDLYKNMCRYRITTIIASTSPLHCPPTIAPMTNGPLRSSVR